MNTGCLRGLCVTVCAALCLTAPTMAATYHVAPGGDDASPGDEQRPWSTLEHAAAQLGPGDTLVLDPGEYPGQLRLARGGGPDAPITVRSAQRHQAILTGVEDGHTVVLEDVAHVRLAGLRFCPASSGGQWLRAERARSLELVDLMMDECVRGDGLRIIGCSDVRLTDCVLLDGTSGNMAHVSESERIVLEGCELSGSAHALLLFLPDRTNREIVIRGCVFAGRTGRTVLLDSIDRLLFENNIIVRSLDGGRSADSRFGYFATNSIFRGCRVFDNWGTRLFSVSPYRDTLDFAHVRVYHNVFHGNTGTAIDVVGTHSNVSDAVFANNVLAGNERLGSAREVVLRENSTPADVRFVGNLIDGAVQLGAELMPAGRAAGAGLVEDTVATAPLFRDPAVWEHLPGAASPLIDGGIFLTRAVTAGQGRRLQLEDARWFYDGFGIEGERGDLIAVGSPENLARVVSADHGTGTVEIDRPLQWGAGDPVSLAWAGAAPDIGVFEVGLTELSAPVVVARPYVAAPGESVLLRALMPADMPGARVLWSLTDGTTLEGAQVEHAFAAEGEYGLRVRVETADGSVARAAGYVIVQRPRADGEPLAHSTFEDDDTEWWWRWQTYRPGDTDWQRVPTEDGHALQITAPADRTYMPCRTNPRDWWLNRDPIVTLRYRISPGVATGAYFEAFPTHEGTRRIWVAGTPEALPLPGEPEGAQMLVADGAWHSVQLDARVLRERWPDAAVVQRFGFEPPARERVVAGQQFWIDDIVIGPAQ